MTEREKRSEALRRIRQMRKNARAAARRRFYRDIKSGKLASAEWPRIFDTP